MSAAKRPLTLATALAAAGVATTLALPGGTAFADTNPPPTNLGDSSIAAGNQVTAPVSVPVDVCGIAIAILGNSNAGCQGGATAKVPQAAAGQGGTGVGSGNNVSAPVSVPVDVCGLSVSVLGSSQSGCQGTSTVGNPGNPPPPSWPPSGPPGGKPPGGGHHHKPPKHHHPHHPGGGGHHGHHGGGHHGGGGNGGGGGGNHGGGKGGHHGGTSGHGKSTGTGTTTLTTASSSQSGTGQSGTSLSAGTLPTTGINLLGILIAAIGSLMAGAAALVTSRRRSAQQA